MNDLSMSLAFKILKKAIELAAVCPMAKALEDLMLDKIEGGVVVTKYGYSLSLNKIKVLEAGR